MRGLIFAFLILIVPLVGWSQKFYYDVTLKIKQPDNTPIEKGTVKLFDNSTNKLIESKSSNAEGAANFKLDVKEGTEYRIEITKEGFIPYKLIIDSKIPGIEGLAKAEYSRKLIVKLEPGSAPESSVKISRKIKYLTNIKDFEDDPSFNPNAQTQLTSSGTNNNNSNNENIAKYNSAIKKGNELLKQNKLPEAKAAFTEALAAKPNDKIATDKIAEIEKKQKAEADKKKFDQLVAEADKLVAAKKLEKAKDKYLEALEIFPEDKETLQKIANINAELAKGDEKKRNQLKAMETLNLAKNLLKQNKLPEAKLKFEEVLAIEPTNKEAKLKIAEIDKKIADNSKPKFDENKFKELVENGDRNVANENFVEAINNYNDALKINPNDKQTIAKRDKAKKMFEQYKEKLFSIAVKQGDEALKNKDYEIAKMQFEKALTLKPSDNYPKNKLREINKILSQIDKTLNDIKSASKDRNAADELDYRINQKLKQEKLNTLKREQVILERKKKNFSTKYETENPITKLYDAVDKSEK